MAAPSISAKNERPDALAGVTYKIKTPLSEHALYITINDLDGRPFEIFINSKNMEHYQWMVALTRMISAVFRRGGEIMFVAEELRAVFDPRGGYLKQGGYVPSLVAEIGMVIERHLSRLNKDVLVNRRGVYCPSCGGDNAKLLDGCFTCLDCGYSKCG